MWVVQRLKKRWQCDQPESLVATRRLESKEKAACVNEKIVVVVNTSRFQSSTSQIVEFGRHELTQKYRTGFDQ